MNPEPKCKSILVVCEGNHCRSPIAAGLLQEALGAGFRLESAGLAAPDGLPAHPEACRLMAARGIDISSHLSRQMTPAMALSADIVLVMDQGQKEWCESLVPSVRGRTFLLGHWQVPVPTGIEDPFPLGPKAFPAAFEAIEQCVSSWIPHLVKLQRSE